MGGVWADSVSHLLFVDDSLAFMKASESNCDHFLEVLELYKKAADQTVNFSKSSLFFSKNVTEEAQGSLKAKLGVTKLLGDINYQGLPIIIRRKKQVSFEYLRDRVKNKVAN
ncbi:uncharacterized protein [Rutidosis leptorrhynchoides]|uniref:uncharacterized protein n=1 Tax=Rutidosis leptorrhynchoides TaxID=125765 RepID=UPI003A997465